MNFTGDYKYEIKVYSIKFNFKTRALLVYFQARLEVKSGICWYKVNRLRFFCLRYVFFCFFNFLSC